MPLFRTCKLGVPLTTGDFEPELNGQSHISYECLKRKVMPSTILSVVHGMWRVLPRSVKKAQQARSDHQCSGTCVPRSHTPTNEKPVHERLQPTSNWPQVEHSPVSSKWTLPSKQGPFYALCLAYRQLVIITSRIKVQLYTVHTPHQEQEKHKTLIALQ